MLFGRNSFQLPSWASYTQTAKSCFSSMLCLQRTYSWCCNCCCLSHFLEIWNEKLDVWLWIHCNCVNDLLCMSQSWPLDQSIYQASNWSINQFNQLIVLHRLYTLIGASQDQFIICTILYVQMIPSACKAAWHSTSADSRSVMQILCRCTSLSLLLIKLSDCKHCALFDAYQEDSWL